MQGRDPELRGGSPAPLLPRLPSLPPATRWAIPTTDSSLENSWIGEVTGEDIEDVREINNNSPYLATLKKATMIKSIVLVWSHVEFWPNNLLKQEDFVIKAQRKENPGEDVELVGFTLKGGIKRDQRTPTAGSTKTVEFEFSKPYFSEKFTIGLKNATSAKKIFFAKISFRAGKAVYSSSAVHYDSGRSHEQGEDGYPK